MYFFAHFTVSKPIKVSNRRIVIATDSSSHDLLLQVTTAFRSDYIPNLHRWGLVVNVFLDLDPGRYG
jgi:hypothetical protein